MRSASVVRIVENRGLARMDTEIIYNESTLYSRN